MIEMIKKFAKENDVPIMMDEGISFLVDFIKENNVKNILEIGSGIGFSSIMMANVSDDIFIDTVELDKERYLLALDNINKFNLDKRINIYNLDALKFNSDKNMILCL